MEKIISIVVALAEDSIQERDNYLVQWWRDSIIAQCESVVKALVRDNHRFAINLVTSAKKGMLRFEIIWFDYLF